MLTACVDCDIQPELYLLKNVRQRALRPPAVYKGPQAAVIPPQNKFLGKPRVPAGLSKNIRAIYMQTA